ncbi:MFS transporter [Aquincola tertiaricarbonis]|uniref:MFS transporter n=1 Tax=Aquincola tertiaricarbonis TaxID=391953 RepID=UPI000614E178|nr:MFS transporter [Aquincola tertiaricarbonis]
MPEAAQASSTDQPAGLPPRALLALIGGQIGLHGAMAGVRLAAPLQLLQQGGSALSVGLLMALFAVSAVLLALAAGRMADRHGYHRPMRAAVAMTALGAGLPVLGTWLAPGALQWLLLGLAAVLCGGGANVGLITIQRTAGRNAGNAVERMRVFSWLGLAPALSNVVGAVSAGALIDLAGFRAAYLFLFALPLCAAVLARSVPRETPPPRPRDAGRRKAWDLLRLPGIGSLLGINWLLSACWDVHSFAVPILGHERGFSASTIGLILGVFPLAVTGVRVLIPLMAARLQPAVVLRAAMLSTGAVFMLYPFIHSPWLMGACATVLGLTLGCVQPMIMSTLHALTPHDRHGEALALRSMTINAASTLMPLLFGATGAALGVAPVFWVMGAAVGLGARLTRRL